MSPSSGLSDAELELLKHLWSLGPVTVRQLHEVLAAAGYDGAYTTVQTVLLRMAEKGYVRVDRGGFAHVFAAAMTRDTLVGQRLDELRDQVCDGAVAPLLHNLAAREKFTAAEIARFRRLLDAVEPESRGEEE